MAPRLLQALLFQLQPPSPPEMAPPALGPEIYARGFRFSPTPQEAVTYYLPRLVSGDPAALHDVVRPVIHRADVYACDPADLARRFRPMPRTHNRFFFTAVKKGVRAAGPGSWAGQSSAEIKDKEGVRIGELRKFRYKKRGGDLTDWLMEEYSSSSCCLDGATGGGGMQPVLCKVYVSPKAAPNSDAYKESAACFAPAPPPTAPSVITQPATAAKRPPTPPQDVMPPCAKKMRVLVVQSAPSSQPPAVPAPALSSHTAVRKMLFEPPQSSLPRRCATTPSATQPSPASAPPPPPQAPTKLPLATVQIMSFTPPQPFAPCRGSMAPSATQPLPVSSTRPHLVAVRTMSFAPPQSCVPSATKPSPASAPPLAPPVPIRPAMRPHCSPMPLPAPPQRLVQKGSLLPTPPAARACDVPVQSKQRRILDPFEATMLRDEAEEQTVAAAPHPPPPPAATPALQDGDEDEDDWDDLDKALDFGN